MDLVPTPLIQDGLISGASPAKTPFPNMGSLMNSFGSTCLWGGPQFSPRHLHLSKHLTTFLEFEPPSLVGRDEPAPAHAWKGSLLHHTSSGNKANPICSCVHSYSYYAAQMSGEQTGKHVGEPYL